MDSDDEDVGTTHTEDHNLEGKREGDTRDEHGHPDESRVHFSSDGQRRRGFGRGATFEKVFPNRRGVDIKTSDLAVGQPL